MPNKSQAAMDFADMIFRYDEDIRVSTAQALAADLGVDFDPQDFDLG